jgi:hypothetical protein
MLSMLPLLVADPDLPAEVRRALLGPKEDAVRALVRLGVSCRDAIELTWRTAPCESCGAQA